MTIRQIELVNFQSHAKTVLELGDFTAITGESSSGKTSLFERAFNWFFFGEWDSLYPADPQKPTAMAVLFDDGRTIVRMRQDDKNRAWILNPGETIKDKQPMRDFGKEIPGIFDVINVRLIEMGDKFVSLNFSGQDDPTFLINPKEWSKPARAQWLGRLYGAHVVNAMLKLIAKDKLESEKSIRSAENELQSLQERRKGYEDLEVRETALNAAELNFDSLRVLCETRDKVSSFRTNFSNLQGRKWLFKVDTAAMRTDLIILSALRDLNISLAKQRVFEKQMNDRRWLTSVDAGSLKKKVQQLDGLVQLSAKMEQFESRKEHYASRKIIASVDTAGIRNDLSTVNDLRAIQAELKRVLPKVAATNTKLESISDDLDNARRQVKDDLFSGGKCPLCGSKKAISEADAIKHLKHLVGK